MGGRCGRVGWRGVGKASLNLFKITEFSALQKGVGGSVWARGGAVRHVGLDGAWWRGRKGFIESH